MKWHFSNPLALVLAFAFGTAIVTAQSGTNTSQPPQPAIETSHAALSTSIDQPGQAQPGSRVQFESYGRIVSQARDRARSLATAATHGTFNADLIASQHKELKTSLGDLKQEHERMFQALTKEQQDSVQKLNANLVQAHDRLQNLVKEMERELTDSTLHSRDIAEQARMTQREMKSYQKDFRAMGKGLGYSIN